MVARCFPIELYFNNGNAMLYIFLEMYVRYYNRELRSFDTKIQ